MASLRQPLGGELRAAPPSSPRRRFHSCFLLPSPSPSPSEGRRRERAWAAAARLPVSHTAAAAAALLRRRAGEEGGRAACPGGKGGGWRRCPQPHCPCPGRLLRSLRRARPRGGERRRPEGWVRVHAAGYRGGVRGGGGRGSEERREATCNGR